MNLRSVGCVELLVGLAALQRLLELRRSRQNLRKLAPGSRASDSAGNWIALVALQVSWLAGCALEPVLRGAVAPAAAFWTGLVLFLSGDLLRAWCIHVLGPWWNARAEVAPELVVVSRGPYRWIRHPNYLGVLLELVGLPLAAGAWWTLALCGPLHVLVLRRRMRGEDELLFALPGYAAAMAKKGALFPRLQRT